MAAQGSKLESHDGTWGPSGLSTPNTSMVMACASRALDSKTCPQQTPLCMMCQNGMLPVYTTHPHQASSKNNTNNSATCYESDQVMMATHWAELDLQGFQSDGGHHRGG